MVRAIRQLAVAAMCSVFIYGCSKYPDRAVAVYPVDGQLLVGNKPAVDAVIAFHSKTTKGDSATLTAKVGLDGHFVATQPDGAAGLPEGVYRLTATWPDDDRDRLDGKYSSPAKPILEITVKPTVNLLPPINLD